jgi:hypothetical protein
MNLDDTMSASEYAAPPTAAAPITAHAWSTEPPPTPAVQHVHVTPGVGVIERLIAAHVGTPIRDERHVSWGETLLVVWFAAIITLTLICYIFYQAANPDIPWRTITKIAATIAAAITAPAAILIATRRRAWRQLAARADYEHWLTIHGNPRGTHGRYPPTTI